MRLFAILIGLVVAASVSADGVKDQNDADAAAAIAKAKFNRLAVMSKTQAIPYADAMKVSKKDGKPVFATCGFDCKSACEALRPKFITSHETTLEGSKEPRAILAIPDANRPGGFLKFEWKRCPSAQEVKDQFEKNVPVKSTPTSLEWPTSERNAEWDVAMSLAVMSLTSLQAEEPELVGWTKVCENGVCRWVPPTGHQRLPATPAPSVAAPPQAAAQASVQFEPRFPRIAAFRGRVRNAVGLPAPKVVGEFRRVLEQEAAIEAPAAKAATTSDPVQVSGAGRQHRIIKNILARHGVPQKTLDQFEERYGDTPVWLDLLITLLKEGLPKLLELLESLLNK